MCMWTLMGSEVANNILLSKWGLKHPPVRNTLDCSAAGSPQGLEFAARTSLHLWAGLLLTSVPSTPVCIAVASVISVLPSPRSGTSHLLRLRLEPVFLPLLPERHCPTSVAHTEWLAPCSLPCLHLLHSGAEHSLCSQLHPTSVCKAHSFSKSVLMLVARW